MSTRRPRYSEAKSTKRSKIVRRVVQASLNNAPTSSRKSYSPAKGLKNVHMSTPRQNIANSIIMRRQLNAVKDISPPKNNLGYSFIYDESMPKLKKNYDYENKILKKITKSKLLYLPKK